MVGPNGQNHKDIGLYQSPKEGGGSIGATTLQALRRAVPRVRALFMLTYSEEITDMSADVKVIGTLKNAAHIHYVTTRLGTTYSWRSMSIQLIRTNGKVEYRNPILPDTISPRLRVELDKVSKHFRGIKQ